MIAIEIVGFVRSTPNKLGLEGEFRNLTICKKQRSRIRGQTNDKSNQIDQINMDFLQQNMHLLWMNLHWIFICLLRFDRHQARGIKSQQTYNHVFWTLFMQIVTLATRINLLTK